MSLRSGKLPVFLFLPLFVTDAMTHQPPFYLVLEQRDVLSRSSIAVGTYCIKAIASLESASSTCVGVMKLWDGLSQVMRDQ